MPINNLTISYPDFQLNTTIEPEQFDTNNLEIVTKINTIISEYNGLTASKIPFVTVEGLTGVNVQTVIESLKILLDAHKIRTDNPHNVTPAQLSVYTKSELDPYLRGGDTVIRSEVFTIINANLGNGTFSYRDSSNATRIGTLNAGHQVFTLLKGNYEVGQNRIECIIDNTVMKSVASGGLLEPSTSTVELIVPEPNNSVVMFKYFERVGITGTGLIVVSATEPPSGFMWYKLLT